MSHETAGFEMRFQAILQSVRDCLERAEGNTGNAMQMKGYMQEQLIRARVKLSRAIDLLADVPEDDTELA